MKSINQKKKKLANKGTFGVNNLKGSQAAKKVENPKDYTKYVQDLVNFYGFRAKDAVELVNEIRRTEERYKGVNNNV